MKKTTYILLAFVGLLLPLFVRCQAIQYSASVPHTNGVPSGSPTTYASWLRYDRTNKVLYRWTGAAWASMKNIYDSDGTVTGDRLVSLGLGNTFEISAPGLRGAFFMVDTTVQLQTGTGTISSQFLTQPNEAVMSSTDTQGGASGYSEFAVTPHSFSAYTGKTAKNAQVYADTNGVKIKTGNTFGTAGQVLRNLGGYLAWQDTVAGGIYSGSGTVPASTIATVTDNFGIELPNGFNFFTAGNASGTATYGTYMSVGDPYFWAGNASYNIKANPSEPHTVMTSPAGKIEFGSNAGYFNIESGNSVGMFIVDNRGTKKGIEYSADYSAGYTSRSLVDKGYVTSALASVGVSDGDKGDITVSSSGTVWNIDADAVGASEIAADAVGSSEIAADAVGSSELASTAVVAGDYTNASFTVDADGRLTSATSGTLGLWDYWQQSNIFNALSVANITQGGVNSGNVNSAPPNASVLGYNQVGAYISSAASLNSGYRFTPTHTSTDYFGVISHKARFQFSWQVMFASRTVRMGYHDTNTVTDATDGAYFEVVDSIVYAKTANNSVRTTHGTTYTLALNTPYTFDVEVNAAGTEARFRVYSGTNTVAVYDQTIATNIPTTQARSFGVSFVATHAPASAAGIGVLYSIGWGTVAGFNRARN